MANSDKDILITPNKGTTSIPEVSFVGQVNSPIKLRVLDDNTLSFEGSAGQLFSINNNLTTGTIFAVSDVSGVPGLSYDANGALKLVPFNGVAMVGGTTTATSPKLVTVQNNAGTRYSLQLQVNSGIVDGQYDGIGFTQGSGGATPLGGIRVEYKSTGYPDIGFYTRSGAATETRRLLLTNAGDLSGGNALFNNNGNINFGYAPVEVQAVGTTYSSAAYYSMHKTGAVAWQLGIDSNNYFRVTYGGGAATRSLFSNNALTITNSGLVGINTATPATYALTVGGDLNVTGEFRKNGVIFNPLPPQNSATIGATLRSDGTNAFWDNTKTFTATFADGTSSSTFETLPYAAEDRYRVGFQITRGYAMGGYQNSTSYKNVCSINHGTITLQNHGDLLTNGQGYCAGGRNSSMHGYVFIAVNGVGGTGRACSKINMNNNTNLGTVNISIDRAATTIMQRDFKFAYVYGGGDSRPDKFSYATDTSALIANGNPEGNVNNPAGGYGATYGWTKSGSGYNFSWAAETYAVWPNAPGTDGSNKTLSARHGFAYWNTAGGYTTAANLSKRSLLTGAEANQVFKFNSGEETWHTGMSKGFMCGMYNGAQNNTGVVVDYAAETFIANSNINRVGPPGSASGAGTEFGSLVTGYDGI